LLRHKYEVFKCFHEFQILVERFFNHTILTMQTDWGASMRNSTHSSVK
jgi:hypothetical protein